MTLIDVLGFLARSVHLGAVSIWLGSGLLHMLARPMKNNINQSTDNGARYSPDYSATVRLLAERSFALSVASGVYLVFDRLANPHLGWTYILVLTAKLVVVACVARSVSMRQRPKPGQAMGTHGFKRRSQGWQILGLGMIALLLGVALTLIYEAEMRAS